MDKKNIRKSINEFYDGVAEKEVKVKGDIDKLNKSLGYTEEDLKKVIDTMCSRWLNDSKMNIYLRPETLFNPTKFQTYVNLSEIKIIQNSSGKINEMI